MAMALELTRFGSLISGSDPKLAATLQDPCKTVPMGTDMVLGIGTSQEEVQVSPVARVQGILSM